jgi:uncharacterized membrane protein YeaQ/YmgE (transglycosylase-associated protein family)
MGIIAFIIIGLIAGLLARALVPGKQAMGWIATALLGIAGSLLGGFIGMLLNPANERTGPMGLHPSGIIASTIGAIVVLLIWGFFARGRGLRT